MKNLKRIVFGMLAMLVMVTSVSAVEVNQNSASNVEELQRCVAAGGICTITGDINNVTTAMDITKDLTIDLGTHTITGTANRIFNIKSGHVTIDNGTITNTNGSSNDGIIYVYGQNSESAGKATPTVVTLGKDLKITGITGVVVSQLSDGKSYGITLDIAADISSTQDQSVATTALAVHGTVKEGNPVINVTGNLTGVDAGIYQAGASTIKVDGAAVTGHSGIVTKSGNLNVINNAKVSGTGAYAATSAYDRGFTPTGAGIQVETHKSYAGKINVNITDSEVASTNNSAIQAYDEGSKTAKLEEMSVTGKSTLKSASDKDIVEAAEDYNLGQFIAAGTKLEGKTDNINKYLPEGTTIGKDGAVGKKVTVKVEGVNDPVKKSEGLLLKEKEVVAGDTVYLSELLGIIKLNNKDYKDYTAVITVRYGFTEKEFRTNNYMTIVQGSQHSYILDKNTLFEIPDVDVSVKIEFVRTYTVEVAEDIVNGTVTVDPTTATAGETVKVTATPKEGYVVSKVLVDDEEITADENGNYTFTMPARNVKVSAEFVNQPTNPEGDGEHKAEISVEANKGNKTVTLSEGANKILEDSLLATTDEELKALLEKDVKVTVELSANKVDEKTLTPEELAKFKAVVEGSKVVDFFDLSILVKAEGEEVHYLKVLSKPITITIDLPTLPAVENGYTRKYYIIREHNGVYEKLDATLKDGKLSFATDKFSKYAVAYVDEKTTEETSKNPGTLDSIVSIVTLAISSLGTAGYSIKKFIRK